MTEHEETRPAEANDALAEISEMLMGYALLLGAAGRIFYEYPNGEWLSEVASQELFDNLPIEIDNEDAQEGQRRLAEWGRAHAEGLTKEALEDLEVDYVKLFINGKRSVLAPPWESVYVNPVPSLFQCSTMGVRGWYKRYQLEIGNVDHEPDDHAGLELSFASHLCALAAHAADEGDESRFREVKVDLKMFLQQHPFRWVSHWCDRVMKESQADFYQAAAQFTKGLLEGLSSVLDIEIKEEVFR